MSSTELASSDAPGPSSQGMWPIRGTAEGSAIEAFGYSVCSANSMCDLSHSPPVFVPPCAQLCDRPDYHPTSFCTFYETGAAVFKPLPSREMFLLLALVNQRHSLIFCKPYSVTSRSFGCRIHSSYFGAGMRTVTVSLFNKHITTIL